MTALLALVLVASACSEASSGGGGEPRGEPPSPTATPDPPEVDFRATLTPSADEVVVDWSLTNRSGEPLLVANRVPDSYGRLSASSDTAYVVASDTDGRAEIAKRVFAVGSDAAGDSFPWVGVTELADGKTLSEVVHVPLPLEGYAPPGAAVDDLAGPVSSVVFCVGVLVGRDESWGFHDHDGTTIVDHGHAVGGQAVLCSDPVDLG